MNDLQEGSVLRLYPSPGEALPLNKLYLRENLRQHAAGASAFVYANFVTSLDGRIAIPHPDRPGLAVPEQVANARDWRLFQELAVQADVLITSGRYLRDYADGRAQEILRVYDDPAFADLGEWRAEHGLSAQPDLAVVSRSLRFPIPPALVEGGRSVVVITTADADRARIDELEAQLGRVVIAGEDSVHGGQMVDALAGLGYRMIYSAAGPQVLHLLLHADRLDRLYLTFVSRILGGSPFSSIVEGDLLTPPADFRLRSLYLDPLNDDIEQIFSCYDCRHRPS